jgi:hypothetical protein
VIADVTVDGDEVLLSFESKELRFPGTLRDALEFAAATTAPFQVGSLPGSELDDSARLSFVWMLVREGFLRAVRPAANAT